MGRKGKRRAATPKPPRRSARIADQAANSDASSENRQPRGTPDVHVPSSPDRQHSRIVSEASPTNDVDPDFRSFFNQTVSDDATVVNVAAGTTPSVSRSDVGSLVRSHVVADTHQTPAGSGRGQAYALTSTMTSGTGSGTDPPATCFATETEVVRDTGNRDDNVAYLQEELRKLREGRQPAAVQLAGVLATDSQETATLSRSPCAAHAAGSTPLAADASAAPDIRHGMGSWPMDNPIRASQQHNVAAATLAKRGVAAPSHSQQWIGLGQV